MAKKTNGAEGKDRVRKSVTTRRLLCTLTPAELQNAGARLAESCEDISNEEGAQGDIKAQLKAKLAGLEARRNELASVVRRRADYKDVAVETYYDYAHAIVESSRTDTGEVIETRAMTDNERQMRLTIDDEPIDGAAGENDTDAPDQSDAQ